MTSTFDVRVEFITLMCLVNKVTSSCHAAILESLVSGILSEKLVFVEDGWNGGGWTDGWQVVVLLVVFDA